MFDDESQLIDSPEDYSCDNVSKDEDEIMAEPENNDDKVDKDGFQTVEKGTPPRPEYNLRERHKIPTSNQYSVLTPRERSGKNKKNE